MHIKFDRNKLLILGIILTLSSLSCKQGPKEGEPIPLQSEIDMGDAHKNVIMDLRKISVMEAVPTRKYLYLKVNEAGREYWVATSRTEVKPGEVYYYNEALVRTDFESKEMQRVFDTLYLVTRIVPENEIEKLNSAGIRDKTTGENPQSGEVTRAESISTVEAPLVKISAIFKNPETFKDKTVVLSGTCTKINEGILGRNWIHLKDGSADDQDLVITSLASVKPGDNLKFQAVVSLDKDFGAGYRYEVLLEDGILIE